MTVIERRINAYACAGGHRLLSEDKDQGATPFMMPCVCGREMYSAFYRPPEELVLEVMAGAAVDIEWYKPDPKEARRLSKPVRAHVEAGGLVYRVVSERAAYLKSEYRHRPKPPRQTRRRR